VANPQRTAIFIVDADGGNLERLTSWRLDAENPQWSPDGRRLIFQGHFDLATASDIFTMAPDGSEQRRLTHFRPGTNATEPYYAPDRKHVVWRKQGVSVDELFISDPELKTARRLTHFPLGSEPGSPEWWMP
jgi:Tol biopolymer transport system component